MPVLDGHTAAISVSFRKRPSREEIINLWKNFKGEPQKLKLPSAPKQFITYFEEPDRPQVRLDCMIEKGMGISVGGLKNGKCFQWKFNGLSHNTIRGAAGGAILTAELLVAKGYITRK